MTTVVFTRDQVAADTRMCSAYLIGSESFGKIFESDKFIIGMAGAAGQCQRVVDWLLAGCHNEDGEPTIPVISDREEINYQVVFIDKSSGRIYEVEGEMFDLIELEYPVTIGSGSAIALGYLVDRKGKNLAVKAVKAAAKYDPATNDNVQHIDVVLNDPEEDEDGA